VAKPSAERRRRVVWAVLSVILILAMVNLTQGNHFLASMTTGRILAPTIEGFHSLRATTEALITTIGLVRFHKDKGVRPVSLEELAATGYIRQVPIDPYAGKPLVYRQVGDSFALYSCGRDFDDDGGIPSTWGSPPKGGDLVFRPVEEPKE